MEGGLIFMPKKKQKSVSPRLGKHLTLNDRIDIQSYLDSGATIRQIATHLEKSPSTISREIKKHTHHIKPQSNRCVHRACDKKWVCGNKSCTKKCVTCTQCSAHCSDYVEIVCNKLQAHPLNLCNGCTSWRYCRNRKAKYEADYADKAYRSVLKSTRSGFNITDEEIKTISDLATPLIKQGLSPFAVKATLGDALPISEATLRRLINDCKLEARPIDLIDAVKRKPRKKHGRTMNNEITSVNKTGHTYRDYLGLIDYHANSGTEVSTVQMDCVMGMRSDKKVLLTLHFPLFHYQIAILLKNHTSKSVVEALDYIEYKLGPDMFNSIFEVILTDNGHEFTDIEGMERSIFGGKRTTVYFCEPNRSDQKSQCETNHKLIRYIIPKKTSFEFLTQDKVNLMMNHINSYPRKSLGGKTPHNLASICLPKRFFDELDLSLVPAKVVNLKPDLLKK